MQQERWIWGSRGKKCYPNILADTLTNQRGRFCPFISVCTPNFSDLPPVLCSSIIVTKRTCSYLEISSAHSDHTYALQFGKRRILIQTNDFLNAILIFFQYNHSVLDLSDTEIFLFLIPPFQIELKLGTMNFKFLVIITCKYVSL